MNFDLNEIFDPHWILAALQGLTEFLPISSTAHLIAAGDALNIETPVMFMVAVHFGTLLAGVVYLRRHIVDILASLFGRPTKRIAAENRRTLLYLCVATIPVAAAGYFLVDRIESLAVPPVVAATVAGFGILLWLADRWALRVKNLEDMNFVDALIVGVAQAAALVPGVSRSGAAITAMRTLGFTRRVAVSFSYLAGLPIILAAAALMTITDGGDAITWRMAAAAGISFVTALLSMHGLMVWSAKSGFAVFMVYRLFMAGWILAAYLSS